MDPAVENMMALAGTVRIPWTRPQSTHGCPFIFMGTQIARTNPQFWVYYKKILEHIV